MLQVNISVRDKSTFYIIVDMDLHDFSTAMNIATGHEDAIPNGFINIVDKDGDIYMIRVSEITDVIIHELSEGASY